MVDSTTCATGRPALQATPLGHVGLGYSKFRLVPPLAGRPRRRQPRRVAVGKRWCCHLKYATGVDQCMYMGSYCRDRVVEYTGDAIQRLVGVQRRYLANQRVDSVEMIVIVLITFP